MSDFMIALLVQFVILAVFAMAIRSVNKGKPGKVVVPICGLFCIIFTGIVAGLNFPVLLELAPTLRTLVVETTVSSVEALKSVL
ncbi:MAG: hypothetical protein ACRCTP_02260 [Aeromonas popoffii]|uniref:hypothetical protein n=1 Tax=Aeromonas popoffii TaxID=70856 RepID=UPI003F3650EC